MRVMLSGGGTGGHIYPAITISKAIEKRSKSCQVLFVGTNQGLEADIIPKEGYDFKTIDIRGFERRLTLQNLATLFKSAASIWQSQSIIRKFKPDIVIGTGGYVCGPVLLAASLLGVPTIIQEQNVIPGITNKILARFVDKIAVGYADAANYFPSKDKVIFTGNPIRPEVMSASRQEGIEALGLDPKKRTILISGGSRGARSINQAMVEVYKYFIARKDVQLLHVTGKTEYNGIVGNLEQSGIDITSAGNISIKPYLYNMPLALAAADLAIFRAGAVGLAELTARGIPSILIPYPYAAENHQEHNALVMENHGAAAVIRDKELSGERLLVLVKELIDDPSRLELMAAASKRIGRPEAAEHIAEIAIDLTNTKS
ncbi:MAG: undecaprenyldiphospho-muramoylpentapeptide beta-N-acetylglucosaminyltransferase [Veillonellaceae bacterium]|jgi:UDP-N-acetylglucosamine--N-acetylmuramyl-(pentapeptide) pyrophosphoryl-undecaprenol N-acetylglucosamine transferase|nr:undecaprenyldiphospho-muramoylpentapeptide beta-N-acetylglucosaminyltransferase [Veillonellaceae bacterium]